MSESDIDDEVEEQIDEVVDEVGDDDDAGTEQTEQPDADIADEGGEQAALEAARKRRAIADRAEQQRLDRDATARAIAAETVRATVQATEQSRRAADEERSERELRASMMEDQRITYDLAKEVRNAKQVGNNAALMSQSASDQGKFSRTLQKKPQYAKYEDEVERKHNETLQRGGFISRDVILAHMIGEKMLKAENVRGQKEGARRRVEGQRQGSGTVRGNTSGGGRGGKTLVQRMEESDAAI